MKWFENLTHTFSFFRKKESSTPIDFPDLTSDPHTAWWGTFAMQSEQSRYVKIGSVVVCIDHYDKTWNIAHYREHQDKTQSKTIATHINQAEVTLKPLLPDRPVLFSSTTHLVLPPKTQMHLYLSTPVFIQIYLGNPPVFLDETPSEMLSDTWFGKNTQTGELCYAASCGASADLEELPKDNTHVITPILVSNHSLENVLLKEIRIPANYLSLFSDPQNYLWTEQLSLTFLNAEANHTLIEKGAPKGLKELTLLSSPRYTVKTGFSGLFHAI